MIGQETAIRDIYTSDIILADEEIEMLYNVNDSFFDIMEEIQNSVKEGSTTLTEEQLDLLEKSFNDFYFEYAYVQFKRGLMLGLSLIKLSS